MPTGSRTLRILVVAPTSFFSDTGCHVRILEEVRILERLGHHVEIATYRNGGPANQLRIHRTLPIPWRRGWEVGSSRHKVAFDLLLGLTVLRLLATRRFDLIHAHLHEGGLIGAIAGRLFRKPMLLDLQGSLTEEMIDHGFLSRDSRFFRPMLALEKWIVGQGDRVVASTAHFSRLSVERYGCPPERMEQLGDFVDTDVFQPEQFPPTDRHALRRILGLPSAGPLIVYLGLLAPYQGTDLLLEAMPRILDREPDTHLLLMGYPFVDRYRDKAESLGIGQAVTLTGRMPYADVPRHLALGDVAVAPKISQTEGLGKLLNYMAMGLPTVAFDVPVAREYLGDLGLYAETGNAASLAECICGLLEHHRRDPDGLRELRCQLRERARERFGWQPVGQALNRLYAEILDES